MHEAEAKELLEARVAAGGRLVAAQRSDWRTVKLLRDRCLEAGIPTMLVAAAGSG